MSKTSLPLKNLRGVLLLLIVAFHSFSAYIVTQPTTPPAFDLPPYDWRVFPIIDNERWLGFDLFCAFQFLYLMQFMFFLSGLFVWPSLQRKGWKGFLAHRLVRLGIPFLIGVYLVMPIAFYPVYRVTAVDPSRSSFWAHWTALPITPTGPMWFLWFLLALDFCAAAIFKLALGGGGFVADLIEKITQQPQKLFVIVICITALAYLPLSALYSPWYWAQIGPFEVQATFAPQYALSTFRARPPAGHRRHFRARLRRLFLPLSDPAVAAIRAARSGYAGRRQGDARAHRHGVRELGSKRLDRPCSDRLPSRVHARCGVARR
jgi:hypothetical protein